MPLAQPSLFDFIAKRQQANPYNEANTGPLQFPTRRGVQPSRAPTQEFKFVSEPQQTTTTTGATTTTTTTRTTTIIRNYTNVPCEFTMCEGVLATFGPALANTRREIQTTEPALDGLPLEVAVRNAPPASVVLPRQSYTIAEKLRLLQEFRKVGGKQAAFAAKHKIPQQTLSTWLKEEKHLLTLKARGFGKCKRKGIEEDEADDDDVAAEFEKDVDADALGDGDPEDTEPEAAPLAPRPALVKIPLKRVRPAAGPAPATRHRTDSPNCAFCDKLDDDVTRTCKKCPTKFHHFCVIERYGEDEVEDLCPRCHSST
jgi:hypothetical protein